MRSTGPQRLRSHRLRRAVLRRAALRYAAHGWDVVPGAHLVGTRFDCEEPGCHAVTCHPALTDWEATASHDPRVVRPWWDANTWGVLLASGRALDVVEVPAVLGRATVGRVAGPVAVTSDARWLFLVRPGAALVPELEAQFDVLLHGRGSWVPAPPTDLLDGRVRWEASPDEYDWRLPDPYEVQQALLASVRMISLARPAVRPRQLVPSQRAI
jgi:hypothetical protein